MKKQNPLLEYLKPQSWATASIPQSPLGQSLGNTQANQLAQPKIDLPRWAGKQRVGPSVIRQSLDNVKNNKKEKRNVASDDWFHINSKPNNKDFF